MNKETTLGRMRRLDEIHTTLKKTDLTVDRMLEVDAPPSTRESFDFMHAKQDAYLGRVPEGFPERPRSGLLWWVLVFVTFAFLSGSVFQASRAEGQGSPRYRCVNKLSALVNPSLMSSTTAVRKARRICDGLSYGAPNFFKAITQ